MGKEVQCVWFHTAFDIAPSNPTQTRLMSRTVFIENMSGYNELGTTS